LPFVRHPEYDQFLEEDWLFEAITETYLPLLNVFEGLVRDGIDFRITLTLTPTLCAMLNDTLLRERYQRYLHKTIELAERETERTRHDAAFGPVARFYLDRLNTTRTAYQDKYHCDLVAAFRRFQDEGFVEIITCGATHGFLPLLLDSPEVVRAQLLVARDDYRANFGRNPTGIWLPECAFDPRLGPLLQEMGVRWFALDTHGLLFGEPRPAFGVYAPAYTPHGPAAFSRDIESGKQVWSLQEGYPGDPYYREFHRDIGFELDYDYVRPYLQATGDRKFTGLKYHRVTGRTTHKEPYIPEAARERASVHAGNFMFNREHQIRHLASIMQPVKPLIVSPYDAELFGHWWYEGPEFLDFLLRKMDKDQDVIKTTTPTEHLLRYPRQQIVEPCACSWGHKGFSEVWLDECNSWIYPHLHTAGARMVEVARANRDAEVGSITDRALRQAARELLLAQSSDWAFIMKTGTTVPYATKRTKDHLLRFQRLYEGLRDHAVDERFLENTEWRDNLFPTLDWRHYL
jgi:1,4-alpha-glucan branching enzyme